MKNLSAKELMSQQNQFAVIDVRAKEHYDHKHIPGAVHLPFDDKFVDEARAVFPKMDTQIVCYDKHEDETEAQAASEALEAAGYTNVAHLTGGLMAWMEAGGMIESGQDS